jgi:hypothetical protein
MEQIFNMELLKYILISIGIVIAPIILGWVSSLCNVQSTLSKRRFVIGYIEAVVYNFICVPIHELSHLIFHIIFGHKVTDVKLFPSGGDPGHVSFKYNKASVYQRMGCYVSAIGPFIVSTILLCVIYWICTAEPITAVRYVKENYFQYKDYAQGIKYMLQQVKLKPVVVLATVIFVFSGSSSKADRKNAIRNCLIPLILTFIVLMILHFAVSRFFDVMMINLGLIYISYLVLTLVVYLFNRLLIALKIF